MDWNLEQERLRSYQILIIRNLRTRLFGVLVHSELGPRTKAHMLVQGLFPVWWAKRDLRNNQVALENDKME